MSFGTKGCMYNCGDECTGECLPKIINIKEEFLSIQNEIIGRPMTQVLIHETEMKYDDLFRKYDLQELQWTLIKKDSNTLLFNPIRPIDEFAITGILNQNKDE